MSSPESSLAKLREDALNAADLAAEFAYFERLVDQRQAVAPQQTPPIPSGAQLAPALASVSRFTSTQVTAGDNQNGSSSSGDGAREVIGAGVQGPSEPGRLDRHHQVGEVESDAQGREQGGEEDSRVAEPDLITAAREIRHRGIHQGRAILAPHSRGCGIPWRMVRTAVNGLRPMPSPPIPDFPLTLAVRQEDGLELGCWIQYEDGWISKHEYFTKGWSEDVLIEHFEDTASERIFVEWKPIRQLERVINS
ncbi:hypothetical protein P7C70_g5047, partial [Phenoliferia sp. Uapishka_3]